MTFGINSVIYGINTPKEFKSALIGRISKISGAYQFHESWKTLV